MTSSKLRLAPILKKRIARSLLELAKSLLEAKPKKEPDKPFQRDDEGYAKVSFKVRDDAIHSLLKLLKQCEYMGNVGHSFTIVLDPNNSEYKREVGFDGDGSDRVKDIEVNDEPLTEDFEW